LSANLTSPKVLLPTHCRLFEPWTDAYILIVLVLCVTVSTGELFAMFKSWSVNHFRSVISCCTLP